MSDWVKGAGHAKRYTERFKQTARDFYQRGMSCQEVAQCMAILTEIEIAPFTIRQMMKRLGVARSRSEVQRQRYANSRTWRPYDILHRRAVLGQSLGEIRRALKCDARTIRNTLKRAGVRYNDTMESGFKEHRRKIIETRWTEIAKLREAGWTYPEIRQELGVGHGTIARALKEFGMVQPGRRTHVRRKGSAKPEIRRAA